MSFVVNIGAARAQLKAGAVNNRHGDNIAADSGGIGFGDEIENGDGADDFGAVDRALQHQRGSRLGPGDQVYRDIEPDAGARSRRLQIAEGLLPGIGGLRLPTFNM